MTRADDVRELIREQSDGPEERRAMQTVAGRLEESLAEDVPFRPEFQAELRRRLMAEARRELTPWYKRPAVWGSTVAVAAAAAVLAVGLNLWQAGQPGPTAPTQPSPQVADKTGQPGSKGNEGVGVDSHLVSSVPIPAIDVPAEVLPEGSPGPESIAGLENATRLSTYQVTGQADQGLFARMARGLGFAGQGQAVGGGFQASEGTRSLEMSAFGHIRYRDTAPAATGGAPVDAMAATRAAEAFLQQAALPVPSQPVVLERTDVGGKVYAVQYTPRVENRPVVNARTQIQVNAQGRVTVAEADLLAAPTLSGTYAVISSGEALGRIQQQNGGTWDGVDLVYVRTETGQAVFLQPYWRVYGASGQGVRMVRYVPALTPANR
jgi:hypothetical protein